MRMNHVQERLINELLDYAKIKYPETEIQDITEAPSGEGRLWVIVKGIDWDDDDKSMDFMEYLAPRQDDVLVEYGYPISLMPIGNSKSGLFGA